MEKHKTEQQEKSIPAAQLADKLTHSQEVENDIHEWVSLIRKYMGGLFAWVLWTILGM